MTEVSTTQEWEKEGNRRVRQNGKKISYCLYLISCSFPNRLPYTRPEQHNTSMLYSERCAKSAWQKKYNKCMAQLSSVLQICWKKSKPLVSWWRQPKGKMRIQWEEEPCDISKFFTEETNQGISPTMPHWECKRCVHYLFCCDKANLS